MHYAFPASFLGKIPNTPKLLPMPGKKFTWAVLKLWDLCLYICVWHTLRVRPQTKAFINNLALHSLAQSYFSKFSFLIWFIWRSITPKMYIWNFGWNGQAIWMYEANLYIAVARISLLALDKYNIYLFVSYSIEDLKLNQYRNFQLILPMCFHFMRYFVHSIIFRVYHMLMYCVFIEVDFEK